MKEYLYDSHCQDLAEHFLSEEPYNKEIHEFRVKELSQAIQDAVEAWMNDNE